MSDERTKVTIIGGGFGGLALSLLLENHGVSSAIYETRDEAYTSGGSIALAPNALRVLDHIGIFDKIRLLGYNYDDIEFINDNGTRLGTFHNGSRPMYGYHALRIKRTVVRDVLREQCRARGIPIHYNMKCVDVEEEVENPNEPSVTAHFADGTSVSSLFLIGADGIHSQIRKYVAPGVAAPHFSGQMGVMGMLDAKELEDVPRTWNIPAMMFGGAASFAIIPSSYDGTDIGYFATVNAPDRSREDWDILGDDKAQLHKMLEDAFAKPGVPEYIQALTKRTPEQTLTNWPFFYAPQLSTWTSATGRVLLIGDAAHAMPPTGGQGAAMAFEDAEALAFSLSELHVPEYRNAEKVLNIVKKWEQHRIARVNEALGFTNRNGAWRKAPSNFVDKALKEWTIWAAMAWSGPGNGAEWLYRYNADSVKKELE